MKNQFCSPSVWDLLRLTPWVFQSKFLRDVCHCVYGVLADDWVPDSSHKTGNKLFIDHCQGWKEGSFVWHCLIFSWVNTHPLDLKFVAFCPEFSAYSYVEFQEKIISVDIFIIFHANQGLYKTWEISPYVLQFLFCLCMALKKFTQVLSYVVCTQVRRHVHKGITKRIYGEEKPAGFVFGKTSFVHSQSRTYYT